MQPPKIEQAYRMVNVMIQKSTGFCTKNLGVPDMPTSMTPQTIPFFKGFEGAQPTS